MFVLDNTNIYMVSRKEDTLLDKQNLFSEEGTQISVKIQSIINYKVIQTSSTFKQTLFISPILTKNTTKTIFYCQLFQMETLYIYLSQLYCKMNPNPQIPTKKPFQIGQYTIDESKQLGKGATSIVYRARRNSDGLDLAVKVIDNLNFRDNVSHLLLQNQKEALKSLKGLNRLQLYDIVQQNKKCYIFTSYCPGVTLNKYLKENFDKLKENEVISIFKTIVKECLTFSTKNIIHRDLKPSNIMIDFHRMPTIIDFGFCEIIRPNKVIKMFNVGSPSYMAPEAYHKTIYSEKSDVWSLGIILYQMLHGHPLDEKNTICEHFSLLKIDPEYLKKKMNQNISLQIRQMLVKSLTYNSQERLSISGLKYLIDKYQVRSRHHHRISMTQMPQKISSKVSFGFQQPRQSRLSGQLLTASENIYNRIKEIKQKEQIKIQQIISPSKIFNTAVKSNQNKQLNPQRNFPTSPLKVHFNIKSHETTKVNERVQTQVKSQFKKKVAFDSKLDIFLSTKVKPQRISCSNYNIPKITFGQSHKRVELIKVQHK